MHLKNFYDIIYLQILILFFNLFYMWNNTMENNKNEKKEIYNNSIDYNLDQLEQRIKELNEKNWFYSYEKDENWFFYAICNWKKLDIPLENPDKLIDVLKFLKNAIDTYLSSWYSKEKLYVSTNWFMSWPSFVTNYHDIFVDNRKWITEKIMWDTTFLTDEAVTKMFWSNQKWFYSEKIANFLNDVFGNN